MVNFSTQYNEPQKEYDIRYMPDLFFADSWEKLGQIRAYIERMKAKFNALIISEKGQEY